MQTIAVFATILAVATAHVVRLPSQDNAHIESHRLGGSFSYSSSEGQAYGIVNPVVQNVVSPVASTYSLSGVPSTYSYQASVPSTYSYSGVPSTYSYQAGVPVTSLSYGYSGLPVNTVGYSSVYGTSGVQNVVVPSTSVVQAGTPANTYKTVGVSQLGNIVYV